MRQWQPNTIVCILFSFSLQWNPGSLDMVRYVTLICYNVHHVLTGNSLVLLCPIRLYQTFNCLDGLTWTKHNSSPISYVIFSFIHFFNLHEFQFRSSLWNPQMVILIQTDAGTAWVVSWLLTICAFSWVLKGPTWREVFTFAANLP